MSHSHPTRKRNGIEFPNQRLDFDDIRVQVNTLAHGKGKLSENRQGSFWILEAKPHPDFLIAFLAAWKRGESVAVIDPNMASAELEKRMLLISEKSRYRHPDCQVLLFTSGTSGSVKGVQLSKENMLASRKAMTETLDFKRAEKQILFLPLSYSFGLLGQLLPAVDLEIETKVVDGVVPLLSLIQSGELSGMLSGVPSHWAALLKMAGDKIFAEVTHVISAGARLPDALKMDLTRTFPNATLYNNYGQTEAAPRILSMKSHDPEFYSAATGYPVPGIEAKRNESGELCVRGPQIMLGYLEEPALSQNRFEEGWFKTGDLVEKSGTDLFRVTGRIDDLVKIQGERISLAEVETELLKVLHPNDAAACVIENAKGESFLAAVFTESEPKTSAEITAQMKTRLSGRKVPTRVLTLKVIPKNANGKIDRAALLSKVRENLKLGESV